MEGQTTDPASVKSNSNVSPPHRIPTARQAMELAVVGIWCEAFSVPQVGRSDNFFELGGNSMMAQDLAQRIQGRLNVALPVVAILQNPTPRELAQCVLDFRRDPQRQAAALEDPQGLKDYQSPSEDLEFLLAMPHSRTPQLLPLLGHSRAQFRQDLFVIGELEFKRGGFFVEFGATNGVELSNTYLLEQEFAWTGILAEPARCWHTPLRANRGCAVDTRCVWSHSGQHLPFAEVMEVAELSTLRSLSALDMHAGLRQTHQGYDVETVSLNDLLAQYHAPARMDYLSIDTEGSELAILRQLDFDRYRFNVITCEHNFTPAREELHTLLTQHGYVRRYTEVSKVDDWYVSAL